MPTGAVATPRIMIDWYANGDYYDAIDDVTEFVLGDPGLSVEQGRDTARSISPPMIAAADFTLNNQSRAFSPENPETERYQFIRPGRPAHVDLLYGTESAYTENDDYRADDYYRGLGSYGLLTGHMASIKQDAEIGVRTAPVTLLGSAAKLRRRIVSVPFMGDARTDMAVQAVLDAAEWPADKRVLAISDSIMHGFWVDEKPAWDVLVQLVATEGAGSVLWEDGEGVLHWQNRAYRTIASRSLTVQYTLHDGTGASGLVYQSFTYDPRWEDIVSRVTIATNQRQIDVSPSVVWQLGTTFHPVVGTPEIIWARPRDPFFNAITPALGTDYTVAGGTVDIALAWTTGAIAKLTVTALTADPIISDLQLRAQPYTVIGATEIESSVPAEEGDEKTLKIDAWPELDPAHAQAIANSYMFRYQGSRPTIDLTFQNIDTAHMAAILDIQISDRVAITNQHLGLIGSHAWVEKITHTITTGGKHQLTLSCEPVFEIGSQGSLWDSGLWETGIWGL